MLFMDRLPTVISCCFCCFLRAGTVMIGVISFISGIIFAPNVNHTPGFWDLNPFISNFNSGAENAIQIIMGFVSVLLCIVSVLLLIGALCVIMKFVSVLLYIVSILLLIGALGNMPNLIEIYQWGAVVYGSTVFVLFGVLAVFCFFVHTNCYAAGGVLCGLMACDVLITTYFVIVTNSLRISLKLINCGELNY